MIHSIRSTIKTFKTLRFHRGINILLANKSEESGEKNTRNSAGKSSVVEIINFLLGSNYDPDLVFRNDALKDETFFMTVDAVGEWSVGRKGSESSVILVESHAPEADVKLRTSRKDSRPYLELREWRTLLGQAFFKLSSGDESGLEPSFRMLIPYFIRRENKGGFIEPIRYYKDQQKSQIQIAISYLLGLDTVIPQRFEQVREREKALEQLERSHKKGLFDKVIPALSKLRTMLVQAESRVDRLRNALSTFRVLPEYEELNREAVRLKAEIQRISRENLVDQERIARLTEAIERESPPDFADVTRLYEAANIQLPDLVRRRYEDVAEFHESVIRNRRNYLQSELQDADQRIVRRSQEAQRADARRGEILEMLRDRGALSDLTRLQAELAQAETELSNVRSTFQMATYFESEDTELKIERRQLQRRLQDDFRERSDAISTAIKEYASIVSELYEKPGELMIEATENGPRFDVKIQGDRSPGITKMEIFCFDMMLMRLLKARGAGPGFLVHDSHIFDGVDDRQVSKALQIGARESVAQGYQYIVTMNSDKFDRLSASQELRAAGALLGVELSDQGESGGLFGFRFD